MAGAAVVAAGAAVVAAGAAVVAAAAAVVAAAVPPSPPPLSVLPQAPAISVNVASSAVNQRSRTPMTIISLSIPDGER